MSKQVTDPKPHWLRLSDEAWRQIGRAYCNGATARTLAQRWKVSPTTIYRRAKQEGWSKRRNADAIVRKAQEGAPPPETGATYFRLDETAWAQIGAAFCNGATADALAAQWQVAPATILRQARERGWQPRRAAKPSSRAAAKGEIVAPEGMFAPDPRWHLDRYAAGELFDPGMTAQLAASASCGAMLVGDYQASIVLAQIAYAHARILKLRPTSAREIIWEALSDRAACDALFSRTNRDGEEELKEAYWKMRIEADRAEIARREELAAARRRIGELEALLAPASGEAPPA